MCTLQVYAFFYRHLLFESISIHYKTLQLNYFAFEKHAIGSTSTKNTRMLRLCLRFFLPAFQIVSVAVWITVFARFDCCLPSISIHYKTLQLNYFAFEKHAIGSTSTKNTRMLRLCLRFFLPAFQIVSVAVWITVFARFDRRLIICLFQSITKHWSTGARLFCIWNFLYLKYFFVIRELLI